MIHRTLIAVAGSIESLGDENYALCVLLVRYSDPAYMRSVVFTFNDT